MKLFYFVQIVSIGCIFFRTTVALTCFENNEETGELEEVENDEFVYCRLFPASRHPETGEIKKAKADGLKHEEVDGPFEEFFELSASYYQILSICLYEKYDFPKMWKLMRNASPKSQKSPKIEYQFRCLCNTDRCNTPTNLEPYLVKLRNERADNLLKKE
uniref:Uncharacterized protein n=1 Tax=Acrobeloides nanus TaxID=290746 RepID=A0A914CNX1_9BILA